MKYDRPFYNELVNELNTFLSEQEKRFPKRDLLTIDLHCHDHNSNTPDEVLGRILNIPETYLPTDDLLDVLKNHGCDTFTVTNHNNARTCYELRDRGFDVVTGAEFSCMVPDYKTGIHVLTFGFTPKQEKELYNLRYDIYRFQEYTHEHDIPTIWAHPLYYYRVKGVPPLDFFDKMALLFERFEVMNGQRDTWQNMLVKIWLETLTKENIDRLSKKLKIPADRYCRNPYLKAMAGGSDSHMGIFTGLTGTRLYVEDLNEKLKLMTRSKLALEAIKRGDMAPYGSYNDSEKMTATFLDYFCQVAMNIGDPGLMRILLHKGESKEKILSFLIANGFAELKQHRVTMTFLELFHKCFKGQVPGLTKRILVKKIYRPIFHKATELATVKRDNPREIVKTFKDSIHFIYEKLNEILFMRLTKKLKELNQDNELRDLDLNNVFESLELPSQVRKYIQGSGSRRKSSGINGLKSFSLSKFLDGLPFPFLASTLILASSYASARVMYNTRDLLAVFSEQLGRLKFPRRMLWLTDTLEDSNGVAMVLRSMHQEIQKRKLPIDLLVCSSKLKSDDHLIVVPPLAEFTVPFYEQQPIRIPDVLDIHTIFQEGEYDRLICSTEGVMGLITLFLKSAYTVPAHFYVHTDWMMFARKVLNFDHQNRSRLRRILRAFYRGFDSLFVLNNDQRAWLTGRDMGFDPARVHLTAHWADEGFGPKKSSKEKIFGVGKNDQVLLFAGRVSHEKGVMEIPQIYRKVKEAFPNVKVAIAGMGPREKQLKEELPEGIFLGWVDHDRLPEVYSAADILLLPSRFDTFGVVVLEALSCGLPVVAYKTKGPKDIILHGKNGYLVKTRTEMVNAIREYFGNRRLHGGFRKAALKRAADYQADSIIARFLKDVDLAGTTN